MKITKKQLTKIVKKILHEEVGRDLKTVKFGDQVDILKDPRISVEFLTIPKYDESVEHQFRVTVHEDPTMSTHMSGYSTNDEATHWARNTVKNILVKLDQKNNA
jgi:hypothetical protein